MITIRLVNETKLPDPLVLEVIQQAHDCLVDINPKLGVLFPGDCIDPPRDPLDFVMTVRVLSGVCAGWVGIPERVGLEELYWGVYVEMRWPVRPQDGLYSGRYRDDEGPDMISAMDTFSLCVHELGHALDHMACLTFDAVYGGTRSPSYRDAAHEVRARGYERKVMFNLWRPEIRGLLQKLALACQALRVHPQLGDAKTRRDGWTMPKGTGKQVKFTQNRIRKYCPRRPP